MSGIVDSLLCGRGIQWDYRANMSEERREIERKIDKERKYFIDKMSLDDHKRFTELEELYQTDNKDMCSYSFVMGLLLGLEIIEKKDVIIAKK